MINIKNNLTRIFFAFAALALFASVAAAQEMTDKSPRPMIQVTGEATVMVKPDQAIIDVGVVTQAQNAQAAATQNAQKLDAVIAELRKALGPGADIKTISYSLNPNYRYPKEGGAPIINGYTASNTLEVKTDDLTQVGKIIDISTQSGANNIQSLRFTLKDEQAARSRALGEAALKAKGEAEAIARALGLKLVRVLSVVEGGSPIVPKYDQNYAVARAEVAAPPTPVEPGTIDVRATITLTVEVTQ